MINAFGPEVIGENVEGKVLRMQVAEHSGRKYYQFELEPPHVLITATAAGNRLYLFSVTGSGTQLILVHISFICYINRQIYMFLSTVIVVGLQWKRNYPDLKRIAESFRVV